MMLEWLHYPIGELTNLWFFLLPFFYAQPVGVACAADDAARTPYRNPHPDRGRGVRLPLLSATDYGVCAALGLAPAAALAAVRRVLSAPP